jgi:hypothetical protein
MKKPITVTEQIRHIKTQIQTLVGSYTDLIGPNKGKISDKKIAREVASLQETVRLLRAVRRFKRETLRS